MLRLTDLLAVAVEDMRQGGDPRLPLELALVKITRPQADLSRDSLAHRIELLEARPQGAPAPTPEHGPCRSLGLRPSRHPSRLPSAPETAGPPDDAALPPLELDQLRDAWQRDVVDAVKSRSIPISTLCWRHGRWSSAATP